MKKDTSKLLESLALSTDFHTFYEEEETNISTESLAELLNELLEKKGMNRSQAIKNTELSEVYGYQIFSGLRHPDRKKLLCLALGMGLTADETQSLLKRAGYPPLYVRRPFDGVVLYGFMNQLTVSQINELLFEYGQEMLV